MWKLGAKQLKPQNNTERMKAKSTFINEILTIATVALGTASAGVITDWNKITVEATKTAGLNSKVNGEAIGAGAAADAPKTDER
jgi:hypothetical protein